MTTATTNRPAPTPTTPGAAFSAVLGSAVGLASRKIDDWTSKLNDVASGGSGGPSPVVDDVADELAEGDGARHQAGVRGVQAGLTGRNPVWAAIKGAWSGGSVAVKTAIVAAGVVLVLLLLLSPVLLVVVLLTLLIAVLIIKARSATK